MLNLRGSDSDIMLDICVKCDINKKIDYVWFDTGLEYQATKDHIKYLENRYGINIKTYKALKPIPVSCKEHGQPFISKYVSEMIMRLQRHNFKFEDKEYEELVCEYPNCKSALGWWCNKKIGRAFNIQQNKGLKDFLMLYPPNFSVSNACCNYAKKKVSDRIIKDYGYELNIVGIRKAEGGARSFAYKSCFDENIDGCDNYRPLFWYSNNDKKEYEDYFEIVHSKCYTEYGLKRTGCACCPYGRNFEDELCAAKKNEPKLYKAVNKIFGDSYEYTRKYREFVSKMKEMENASK